MELDSESIIDEVRKYRSLYDVDDPNYRNRHAKRVGWIAVTKAVIGCRQFDSMPEIEKNEIGKEIQRRWKNIKDTYLKTLKPDSDGNPKKPYVFHKKLSFIQPNPELKRKRTDVISDSYRVRRSPEPENGGSNSNSNSSHIRLAAGTAAVTTTVAESHFQPPPKKTKNVKPINGGNKFEKKLWDIFKSNLEAKNEKSQDPDEQFIQSQLQLLKKLRPLDKLDFQIRWMELVKSYDFVDDSDSE